MKGQTMLDKDVLYDLYVVQEKTGPEIAQIVGNVSVNTIYNWLDKYGIPRRDRRQAQRPTTPSKEVLEDLYIRKEFSIDEIQRILSSSESSISRLLDEYGIPKRERWEKMAGWNKGETISEKQRKHLSKIAKKRIGPKSPRYGAKLSQSTRRKIAKSLEGRFRGPDNPQWQGGHHDRRHKWHSRFEYKDWRSAVFERDNYTCQMCGKPSNGDIEAHHIKPFATFPSLRFEVQNGITLCQDCHRSTKGKELEFVERFKAILRQASP